MRNAKQLTWMAVAAGSAALAASVVYKGMNRGWRMLSEDDPPEAAELAHTPWRKALTWAVVTAGVAAAAEVAAQKAAASGWKKATGKRPPRV